MIKILQGPTNNKDRGKGQLKIYPALCNGQMGAKGEMAKKNKNK